jgi:hypothetical protein
VEGGAIVRAEATGGLVAIQTVATTAASKRRFAAAVSDL